MMNQQSDLRNNTVVKIFDKSLSDQQNITIVETLTNRYLNVKLHLKIIDDVRFSQFLVLKMIKQKI